MEELEVWKRRCGGGGGEEEVVHLVEEPSASPSRDRSSPDLAGCGQEPSLLWPPRCRIAESLKVYDCSTDRHFGVKYVPKTT